jgi:VWFA-related protein
LAAHEAARPGRKLILWVSPGWPLLSGPEMQLTVKQEQQLFDDVVSISTQLREANVALYSIDPLGTADIGSRTFYWQSFLKGVSRPSQAQVGNLGLQVIAAQSGGLVLNSSNDVTGELRKCVADNGSYDELTFDAPIDDRPNAYHQLEVKVDKPGVMVRTRQGYYSPK